MENLSQKFKEKFGLAETLVMKDMEKLNFKFYKHPVGFSLYYLDVDIGKERPIYTESGVPSWHLSNEVSGELNEEQRPSKNFWKAVNLLSQVVFKEQGEATEAVEQLNKMKDEELEYHENRVIYSLYNAIRANPEQLFQNEEIVALFLSGEKIEV